MNQNTQTGHVSWSPDYDSKKPAARPVDVPRLIGGFADERKALLSKLSGMHDQFCACMGRHPDLLYLTMHSAEVLGWEEGFRTPYYARVESTCEMQDIFAANA